MSKTPNLTTKMFKPACLFALLSILSGLFTASAGEPEQITFVHIGLNEGLSQSTVFSINQDKRGNMWFATYDGVNKYDGYAFTIYQHDASDPHSIANDIARIITVDSQGQIWIGTRDGLSYYDEKKDRFENYTYKKNEKRVPVSAIAELSSTQLLAGTPEGLLVFDMEKERFMDDDYLSTAMHKLIASTLSRQGDDIYIGTANGLYVYSVANKQFSIVTQALDNKNIQAVLRQSPSRLWVATEGAGLYLVNPNTKEVQNYRHKSGDAKSISSNYIRSLALDAQNHLWIGTFNDLNIYHESTDSFVSYTSNPVQSGSLSQNSVRSIFMDSQGGMWLGTYFGSLNYHHPLRNRFRHMERIPYHNSLNDNVVSCIVEDRDKNLWIGTNDGGINLYDPESQKYTYYVARDGHPSAIGSNNIKVIYPDESQDKVYIGTHAGGFSILNRRTGGIETFNSHNSELNEDNVYAIVPVGDGRLWIATLSVLYTFDPVSKQLRFEKEKGGNPLNNKRITLLYKDSKQRLWIGGEDGLSIYDQTDGQLLPTPVIADTMPVCHAFINCVYEACNGTFWVGTREGVYGYDEEKGVMKHYTTANVLSNNVVYGILEDSFGRLWMSTNKGLTCLDPETGKFRNFTESDGLQSNQFNNYSYCRTSSGQMYFGGVNGITTFIPELLMDNPYTPPVVITGLRLFNKPVRPDDQTGILSRNISDTPGITLNASQTSFSLEFVTANYISGQHNTFAYQLVGYDKEWYYLTDQRSVSYSNLPHGTYTFLVKAANNDGKWNEVPTELEITVLPVWYKTWWATLLFILAFTAFLTFVFRYTWMRKSMKAELEMERMDKERREEVNQMKMRFFIDISHELRTPLTLILAPLHEVVSRVSDRWVRGQLEYIQRNANRLLHLVNQLMDYRRAELGVLKLRVRRGDIHKLIQENFLFYDKLARNKGIAYSLISEIDDKEMLYDANYVELILNNLLSNAFKYTGAGQSITVGFKEENGYMTLRVSDTGIGIPEDKQTKVFDRFFQVSNEQVGSGIGLSLVQRLVELHHGRIELESEVGKGSVFTIFIPQEESVYQQEELANGDVEAEELAAHSVNTRDMCFIDSEIAEHPEPCCEASEKKRGTILIVEDNLEIQHYLSEGLSNLFTTVGACNGEEALDYMKDHEVDLVITDVMMPVMDGIKLTKQVKQNIRTCHIPVFILSAKADVSDQLSGLQVGADDYIPKPFTLSVLMAKIQNMLRTRRRTYDHYAKSLEVEPEKITFNAMDEELLRKAIAIVEKNMDNIEFSADEFARTMNMSRSNLHIKLKGITGESTIDFIRKIRFGEACRLLEDGRYNIAEVSTKVGFNTPSYFATSFKKYFGYLPTEYVKKRRG